MKSKSTIFFVLLLAQVSLLVLSSGAVYADGLNFDGNVLKDNSISIRLSKDQLRTPEMTKMALNEEQIRMIRSATGKDVQWVQYLRLNSAKDTCTCMMSNVGVLYPGGTLKIIVRLLDDKATEDIKTRVKSIN